MQLSIPSRHFSWALNKYTINLFNQLYYLRNSKKTSQLTSYREYFYPLDHITHWNRLYGKKGFIQYQCSLPFATAEQGFGELLNCLHQNKQTFFHEKKVSGVSLGHFQRFSSTFIHYRKINRLYLRFWHIISIF